MTPPCSDPYDTTACSELPGAETTMWNVENPAPEKPTPLASEAPTDPETTQEPDEPETTAPAQTTEDPTGLTTPPESAATTASSGPSASSDGPAITSRPDTTTTCSDERGCPPAHYYNAVAPCDCAACTVCAPGFAAAAPCAARADTLCVAVPPPPEILPPAGDAPFAGYVLVSVSAQQGASSYVNLSLADGAPPLTCERGRAPPATFLLRNTTVVAAVACAVHPIASAVVTRRYAVRPAPTVVVSFAIATDALTPAMLARLGEALAAALGLPPWRVEVVGVRRRRLLEVDLRIVAATADDAAALRAQVQGISLPAVSAASGLAIAGATATIVAPVEEEEETRGGSTPVGNDRTIVTAVAAAVLAAFTVAVVIGAVLELRRRARRATAPAPGGVLDSQLVNIDILDAPSRADRQ